MSKLGNIQESYGKQINIAVANTFGENVLASTQLPKNNIIIASPVDADANDIGTYALFVTDYEGNAVRLTYTIQPGNGLRIDNDNTDIIKFDIDNESIVTDELGSLYVGIDNVIDGTTIQQYENSKIGVVTENLDIASAETLGVLGIDEHTIKTNLDGSIHVETENLDRANENQVGVVTSDNNTINIDSEGVISVNTQNLNYATSSKPGIIKCDGVTLDTTYGGLRVNTQNLKYATSSQFGVSKCDNFTITSNNGIYTANTNNLNKSSVDKFGIIKSDGETTIIDNGFFSIKNYDTIVHDISYIRLRINKVNEEIQRINNTLVDFSTSTISDPMVFAFMCNSVTSVNLTKPKYKEFPEGFKPETITAEFTVNTNCPFKISLDYTNNISPNIYLYEINYDDLNVYPGETGLYEEFQSTDSVDKILKFSWICKNYSSSINKASVTTKVKITVSYSKDNTVSQTVDYNIVRYNSLYNKDRIGPLILTKNTDGTLNIQDSTTVSIDSNKTPLETTNKSVQKTSVKAKTVRR